MASGRNARQPPPVQTSNKTRSSDGCRKIIGRSFSRNAEQHLETSRSQGKFVMRYAVVIEKAANNYSGYVPDLPGCVATGPSVEAVEAELREAIRFHIEGLKEDGLPVPGPEAVAEYVEA